MSFSAPGFHDLETRSDQNCRNCSYFSNAYDGYCIKFSFKIYSKYSVCESFLKLGKIFCPFCSSEIEEHTKICPHCLTTLTNLNQSGEISAVTDSSPVKPKKVQILPETSLNISQKFKDKFELWMQYLLDLSKRNQHLYFNPKSKRTIEIISPNFSELFVKVINEELRIPFLHVFNPNSILKPKMFQKEEEEKQFESKIKFLHEEALDDILQHPPPDKLISQLDDLELEKRLSQLATQNVHLIEEKGINSLFLSFGLLKWNLPNSSEFLMSPILLIPIKLNRTSVKSNYVLEILDDLIISNPSLQQKLTIDYNIQISEFSGEYTKSNLNRYFEDLKRLFIHKPEWELSQRTFISLFSFNKIPLFQELYGNKNYYFQHPFIRSLAEFTPYKETIDLQSLPVEMVHNEDAINVFSILDVDFSQAQAVSYVEQGYSCVIRGPPGTGKSQCIANIIAECLSNQKKVLFVAQKSAALEVVKERLDKTGVGEFCLELHSDKVNKRYVMKQIGHTYNTELKPFTIPKEKYRTLNRLSQHLDEYVRTINAPYGPTEDLIAQKLAALDKLRNIPEFQCQIPKIEFLTDDELYEIESILSNLETFVDLRKNYSSFPWRFAAFSQPPTATYIEIQEILYDFQIILEKLQEKLELFCLRYGFQNINCPSDVQQLADFFATYNFECLSVKIEDIEANFQTNYADLTRYFKLPYFHFRTSLHSLRKIHTHISLADQISNIKTIQSTYLKRKLFESETNPVMNNIDLFITHFKELRDLVSQLHQIQNRSILSKLPLLASLQKEYPSYWAQQYALCTFWQAQLPYYHSWVKFSTHLSELETKNLQFLIKEITSTDQNPNFADRFRKTCLLQWLQRVFQANSALYSFQLDKHQASVQEFVNLDQNVLNINRYRLAQRLFNSRPIAPWLYQDDTENEIGFLNRELIKHRNIKPLREIFGFSQNYLLILKPCLLMSPLSIASFLPLEQYFQYFDLIIFDEASQVCTEEALGAIIRGKQIVIVGDEKQLPPTRFFTSQLLDDPIDQDFEPGSYESILEESIAIGIPTFTLKNHYRSKREDLIVFSNYYYYDHALNTFPDLFRSGNDPSSASQAPLAVEFHYIPEGLYDRGKTRKNIIEAERVATAIIAHYQADQKFVIGIPGKSLGVIAFNEPQMEAVQQALDRQLKLYPDLEKIVDFTSSERLFIKNIENVQGNERDVIFFSIGFGYNEERNFSLNFGALNQQGGERRLNVAISRARYQMKIFCSFRPFDIDYKRTQSQGVRDFFEFLQFAYSHSLAPSSSGNLLEASLHLHSDLQLSIAHKLQEKGFSVDLSIGKSKNQIDIAIVHPIDPSRYILGIVLDHGTYAYCPNTTERERIRPFFFQLLGWQIYHIYSIEWFNRYDVILQEIEARIRSLSANFKLYQQPPTQPPRPHVKTNLISSSESLEGNFYEFHDTDLIRLTNQDREDPNFRQQFLRIPGIHPYILFEITENYTPEDLHHMEHNKILSIMITQIVSLEGPIHFDLLVARISEAYGYKKSGIYVKNRLTNLIFHLSDIDYQKEPAFLYPKTPLTFQARICVDPTEDPRKFHQIATCEITYVILFLLKNGGKMSIEALQKTTMNFFGKWSTSKVSEDHFHQIIEKLLENKQIYAENKWIFLLS